MIPISWYELGGIALICVGNCYVFSIRINDDLHSISVIFPGGCFAASKPSNTENVKIYQILTCFRQHVKREYPKTAQFLKRELPFAPSTAQISYETQKWNEISENGAHRNLWKCRRTYKNCNYNYYRNRLAENHARNGKETGREALPNALKTVVSTGSYHLSCWKLD